MELVDTHCHIQSAGKTGGERSTRQLWAKEPELSSEQMTQNAKVAGVTQLICVSCDLEDSKLVIDFVKDKPSCWASIGIHPHEGKRFIGEKNLLNELVELASQPKVVAIGECGLDYYYEHSLKYDQVAILKYQIELALAHDLPLIFHVREAFDDFWPIFESYKNIRGVLHSFTDSLENMQRAAKAGLYIGVNGIATFTKNSKQLEVYKSVPLANLLLETDAPFLTPAPYRGKINEPKNVRTVAEFLSNLRGENLEQLAAATTANALQLFDI
jgi:TatD DNase family protein